MRIGYEWVCGGKGVHECASGKVCASILSRGGYNFTILHHVNMTLLVPEMNVFSSEFLPRRKYHRLKKLLNFYYNLICSDIFKGNGKFSFSKILKIVELEKTTYDQKVQRDKFGYWPLERKFQG